MQTRSDWSKVGDHLPEATPRRCRWLLAAEPIRRTWLPLHATGGARRLSFRPRPNVNVTLTAQRWRNRQSDLPAPRHGAAVGPIHDHHGLKAGREEDRHLGVLSPVATATATQRTRPRQNAATHLRQVRLVLGPHH